MPMLETTTIPSLDAESDEILDNEEFEYLRHWRPLLDTLGHAMADQFDWKAETDTIQTYEHRLTFRYIHIDGATNCFYNQQCLSITKEAALAHAMPPVSPVPAAEAPETADHANLDLVETQDLELAAFTRPVPAETNPAARTGFDRSLAEKWTARIRQGVAHARKGIFQHASNASGGYPSGAGLVQAGGPLDFQEPSLTRFTRRSSEFQR